MRKCDLEGRDCIANKSSLTFDCLTSCDGIYADIVQWTDPVSMGVRPTIQPLITEYETFKQSNVRHFEFDTKAATSNFGMLESWLVITYKLNVAIRI